MNPGIEAARRLSYLGYRFTVNGDNIKARYEGPGDPDPAQVRPLVALVKKYKVEVIGYLAPKPKGVPEKILSCSECPWCRDNPWTHYPELPAWCGWHMDHLVEDNPSCIGFRRGEDTPS